MVDTVDGQVDTALVDDGLWLTLAALAQRKGVTRQAISRRVGALEAQGLISTRPGPQRTKLVHLAQFDHAVGQAGEPGKEMAAETKAESNSDTMAGRDPRYRDAKTTEARYVAELKRLEYEERVGQLLRVDDVIEALRASEQIIVNGIDRIVLCAGEVAAAALKDGEVGARQVLKAAIFNARAAIVDGMLRMRQAVDTRSHSSGADGKQPVLPWCDSLTR